MATASLALGAVLLLNTNEAGAQNRRNELEPRDARDEVSTPITGSGSGDVMLKVFVSSTVSTGKLFGIAGADATCTVLARNAGLSGKFKAWLSDSMTQPATTFSTLQGLPYGLVDGTKIAEDFVDLTDGSLLHPINLDENGVLRGDNTRVWTATDASGFPRDGATCNGWTSESTLYRGGHGRPDRTDETWSISGAADCDRLRRLFCVEQAGRPPVEVTKRIAFVSSVLTDGALGGIAGADATCTALAEAAGLPGPFKAWLSDSDVDPVTSFSTVPDVPYVLVDDTVIAENFADLVDGALLAPINLDENGVFRGTNTRIWTATRASGERGDGIKCNNWTTDSALFRGGQGRPDRTNTTWSLTGSADCDKPRRLYCLQNEGKPGMRSPVKNGRSADERAEPRWITPMPAEMRTFEEH